MVFSSSRCQANNTHDANVGVFSVLEHRAADLSHLSKKYRDDAKQLNRRSAVFKIFVGMGVAGFLFLLIRFFLF